MRSSGGGTSTFDVIVNLAKLCVGTGILALPVATSQGGIVLFPIVLGIIAVWNAVSCIQLIECRKSLIENSSIVIPVGISSTYAQIAHAAAGWYGVYITDFSVIITLLGVCISYQITFAAMLAEIPSMPISKPLLTVLSGIALLPLCRLKNIRNVSFMSLSAIVALSFAVGTILVYGLTLYGAAVFSGGSTNEPTGSIHDERKIYPTIKFWSDDLSDVMFLVGVSSFCFGLCAAVIPIEENMQYKDEFGKAVFWSLLVVWLIYVTIGDGAYVLYVHDPLGVQDNILRNLPHSSTVANLVRLSMAAVCLLSYALPFVPPTQMLEKILLHAWQMYAPNHAVLLSTRRTSTRSPVTLTELDELVPLPSGTASDSRYQAIPQATTNSAAPSSISSSLYTSLRNFKPGSSLDLSPSSSLRLISPFEVDNASSNSSTVDDDESDEESSAKVLGIVIRGSFIVICTLLATFVPCFGMIISLLGCFTVTILSFFLPAYFHLRLVSSPKMMEDSNSFIQDRWNKVTYLFDLFLAVGGALLCAVSTYMIVADFVRKFYSGTLVC